MTSCAHALVAALLAASPSAPAAPPAALVVANRQIVTFRATVGGNDPAERVRVALQRIDAVPPGDLSQRVTTQPLILGEQRGVAVLVGSRPTFFVVDGDRDPAGSEDAVEQVAAIAADRLSEALKASRDQRSAAVVIRGVWQSGVATALLLAALWLAARLRRVASSALAALVGRAAESLMKGRIDLGPPILATVRGLAFVVFWSGVLILLQLWLTFVLGRFPLTVPWAEVLSDRILAGVLGAVGLAVLHALPGLATVAVILAIARFVARFASGVFERVERGTLAIPGVYPETASATRRIVAGGIWLVALAASYPYIPGSESNAVKGLSLLVGVMLSLGSTGLVAQAMSGLALIYSRALSVGDTVRVGDVDGVVTELGLLSTKICTVPGEEVTFPNSVVIGGSVTNHTRLSRGAGPLVTTSVTIGYDAPWRVVHDLLLGAAAKTARLRPDPAPFVLQRALDDFYVSYQLLARLEGDPLDRPRVLSELHAHVQDAFNAAGVQIMSPHFQVQPDEPVLVPPERWEGDAAPAQRRSAT